MTGEEAAALSFAAVPAALADLGLGTVALSAQLKVRSGMPPELRARADRVAERFHLDAPGWFHHDEPVTHLPAVAEGVWSGHRLDLAYRSGERTVRRRVDPFGLVLKAGTWYLVARHRGTVRTYRVGRIRSAAVRDEQFGRPADFDLATWWADSSTAFDASLLRVDCVVRLSPRGVRHLSRVVGAAAADDALAVPAEPDRDGWRTMRVRGESEEVLADQLLGLADQVEVLEPLTLRARLHELGRAIATRHRPDRA
jgi:predicted DNA-binding transcriptional regulator YafY